MLLEVLKTKHNNDIVENVKKEMSALDNMTFEELFKKEREKDE